MDKNDSVHFPTALEGRMSENEEKVADLDALEAGSRSRSASVGYCKSASDDFVQDWVEGLLMLPWIRKSSSQCRGIKLGQLFDQPRALDLLRDAFLFTFFVGQGLVQTFQYLHLLHRPRFSSIPAHKNTQNLFSHLPEYEYEVQRVIDD